MLSQSLQYDGYTSLVVANTMFTSETGHYPNNACLSTPQAIPTSPEGVISQHRNRKHRETTLVSIVRQKGVDKVPKPGCPPFKLEVRKTGQEIQVPLRDTVLLTLVAFNVWVAGRMGSDV